MLYDGVSNSVKLIDFSESKWHCCPGLPTCRELIETWRLMFGGRVARPFQETIVTQYNLQPLNLEELLVGTTKEEKDMYKKRLGRCLISYFGNSEGEDV